MPASGGRPWRAPSTDIVSASSMQLHPAARPRPVRFEVPAPVVGREPVELRMDARTVVALGVVLADDLPVGGDLVLDAPRAAQARRSGTARRAAGRSARWSAQRPASGSRLTNTKPATSSRRTGTQPVLGRVEIDQLVGVRRAPERPVEVVGPGVVGALEADQRGRALLGASIRVEPRWRQRCGRRAGRRRGRGRR